VRVPRMSTRRWMVAVALVSIGLGGYLEARRLKQRHDACLAMAARHATIAEFFRRPRGMEARLASAEYHATLARRYAAAASRPWFPVASEPLKPK
jgi:hypothetical protein